MTIDEIHRFLKQEFPQVSDDIRIEALTGRSGRIRFRIDDRNLRPGGTVSGPAMFLLADVSAYILILASVGPERLAVTVNCSIDFMRRPRPADLVAEARLLKLGRRLAVADVLIFSGGGSDPVARAGVTYAVSP